MNHIDKKQLTSALISAVLTLSVLASPMANADSERVFSSHGPSTSFSASMIEGSLSAVEGTSELVVTSVQAAGELSLVVLFDAATSSSIALDASATGVEAVSLAVGDIVQLSAVGTGHIVMYAGEVIAYIPLSARDSLFHSSRNVGK